MLAVSADAAHHAPVRATLNQIAGVTARITLAMTPHEALAALHDQDVVLVDRELGPHSPDGLIAAEQLVTRAPHLPVIVLSHSPRVAPTSWSRYPSMPFQRGE